MLKFTYTLSKIVLTKILHFKLVPLQRLQILDMKDFF